MKIDVVYILPVIRRTSCSCKNRAAKSIDDILILRSITMVMSGEGLEDPGTRKPAAAACAGSRPSWAYVCPGNRYFTVQMSHGEPGKSMLLPRLSLACSIAGPDH